MTPTSRKVTKLLKDWSSGDQTVPDKLMPLVYDELRRLAHQYMRREKPGHTLQTNGWSTRLPDLTYSDVQFRYRRTGKLAGALYS